MYEKFEKSSIYDTLKVRIDFYILYLQLYHNEGIFVLVRHSNAAKRIYNVEKILNA